MQKEDMFSVFIDVSRSVSGRNNYWEAVGTIIKNTNINRFFFWNDYCREVDIGRVRYYKQILKGNGGTDTTVVARKIVQEKLTHIILITDAEVSQDVVKKTDEVLEQGAAHNFRILSSICYAISTTFSYINMSSLCPFTRYGDSYIYYKHKNSAMQLYAHYENIDEDYIYNVESINLRNFEFELSKMERIIIKFNMGKSGAPAIRDKLLALRKKLVYELSTARTKEDYSKLIRAHLENQDTNSAIESAKAMTYEYMSHDYSMEIERKINYLVSLCGDLRNQFDANSIKSNKIKNAVVLEEEKIDKESPIWDHTLKTIECPIMMDEDIPQILIDVDEPVLMGFDKKIVDDIAICPLRILNYPEVRAKFKARLSNFTGTKLNGIIFKNPFTQNKLLGAIPLGTSENHVDVGNYTIAQMVSGGSVLGNLNLYFAVIWYLVNEGQIEFLKPIKENLEEHLKFRLRNSYSNASMCGLGQFVATRVTTDVAIWYVVNSGYFNLPTNRDVFRYHIFNMEPMVKILKVLKYPLHKGVKEHFFRTRALLKMLFKLKKYNPNFQKGYHTIFKGFYQKGFFTDIENVSLDFWEKEVCAMFIPIDGEADNAQIKRIREIIPKCCKYLTNEEVYYLSTLLDESKSASDIALDYNAIIPPLPKAQINWAYGLKDFTGSKVELNPGTMRPYLKINDQTWQFLAMKRFGVEEIDELFSGNRTYEKFVLKYKRNPISRDELAIFFYNRFIYFGQRKTLPFCTEAWIVDFIEQYKFATIKRVNKGYDNNFSHLFKIQNNKIRSGMEWE